MSKTILQQVCNLPSSETGSDVAGRLDRLVDELLDVRSYWISIVPNGHGRGYRVTLRNARGEQRETASAREFTEALALLAERDGVRFTPDGFVINADR